MLANLFLSALVIGVSPQEPSIVRKAKLVAVLCGLILLVVIVYSEASLIEFGLLMLQIWLLVDQESLIEAILGCCAASFIMALWVTELRRRLDQGSARP